MLKLILEICCGVLKICLIHFKFQVMNFSTRKKMVHREALAESPFVRRNILIRKIHAMYWNIHRCVELTTAMVTLRMVSCNTVMFFFFLRIHLHITLQQNQSHLLVTRVKAFCKKPLAGKAVDGPFFEICLRSKLPFCGVHLRSKLKVTWDLKILIKKKLPSKGISKR